MVDRCGTPFAGREIYFPGLERYNGVFLSVSDQEAAGKQFYQPSTIGITKGGHYARQSRPFPAVEIPAGTIVSINNQYVLTQYALTLTRVIASDYAFGTAELDLPYVCHFPPRFFPDVSAV